MDNEMIELYKYLNPELIVLIPCLYGLKYLLLKFFTKRISEAIVYVTSIIICVLEGLCVLTPNINMIGNIIFGIMQGILIAWVSCIIKKEDIKR